MNCLKQLKMYCQAQLNLNYPQQLTLAKLKLKLSFAIYLLTIKQTHYSKCTIHDLFERFIILHTGLMCFNVTVYKVGGIKQHFNSTVNCFKTDCSLGLEVLLSCVAVSQNIIT